MTIKSSQTLVSEALSEVKTITADQALKMSNREIAAHLKLPPVKLHCSMLAEDAVKKAVQNYKDSVSI